MPSGRLDRVTSSQKWSSKLSILVITTATVLFLSCLCFVVYAYPSCVDKRTRKIAPPYVQRKPHDVVGPVNPLSIVHLDVPLVEGYSCETPYSDDVKFHIVIALIDRSQYNSLKYLTMLGLSNVDVFVYLRYVSVSGSLVVEMYFSSPRKLFIFII